MTKTSRPKGPSTPEDFPQVEPQELFPSNNIRFVIFETAKLIERVDALKEALSKSDSSFSSKIDRQSSDLKDIIIELKVDFKKVSEKIETLEGQLKFFKGASWVFGGLFAVFLVILGGVVTFLARLPIQ